MPPFGIDNGPIGLRILSGSFSEKIQNDTDADQNHDTQRPQLQHINNKNISDSSFSSDTSTTTTTTTSSSSSNDNIVIELNAWKDILLQDSFLQDTRISHNLSCALHSLIAQVLNFQEITTKTARDIHLGSNFYESDDKIDVDAVDTPLWMDLMQNAVNASIRSVLADILDQVAYLLDLENDSTVNNNNKRLILSQHLVAFSIPQALQQLNRLDKTLQNFNHIHLRVFWKEWEKFSCWRSMPDPQQQARSIRYQYEDPVKLSVADANQLVMELKTDRIFHSFGKDDRNQDANRNFNRRLDVSVTSSLQVNLINVVNGRYELQDYRDFNVQIDASSGSHKNLFKSSHSGMIGEAIVRVHVHSGRNCTISSDDHVWCQAKNEFGAVKIVEARVVQTNAYPRKMAQAKLDMFSSIVHGVGGEVVTMKFKTYPSFNGETPHLSIQLVMAPTE